MSFSISDFTVQYTGTVLAGIEGTTPHGETSTGRFHIHDIRGPSGILVQVAYVVWNNGERNIQPTLTEGPPVLDHLSSGRRRLSLVPVGKGTLYSLLKQARVKQASPNEWSGLYKATRQELDEGCGLDVYQALLDAGARRVGRKDEVTPIADGQRSWPTAIYSDDDMLAPSVAFAITRIIPLVRGYAPQPRLL